MRCLHRCLVVLSAVVLVGCERQRDEQQDTELTNLKVQVETLSNQVAALEQARSLDEWSRDWDEVAYLTPGSDGYSVIRGDLGMMTVSLQNIQPYANGSRVKGMSRPLLKLGDGSSE